MISVIVLYILKKMYYRVSEEDLFDLTKSNYKYLHLIDSSIEVPSDEEIIEAINSCYEIID